jgi:hypothetical protein
VVLICVYISEDKVLSLIAAAQYSSFFVDDELAQEEPQNLMNQDAKTTFELLLSTSSGMSCFGFDYIQWNTCHHFSRVFHHFVIQTHCIS